MTALSITYRQAMDNDACQDSLLRMGRAIGSPDTYGRDTPIPLTMVLDTLGLPDALWALFVVDETRWRHLALDYATRVLPVFEERFPGDTRPRDAIRFYRTHARRPAAWAAGAAWAAWAAWAAEAAGAARAAWAARAARAAGAARAARAAWAAEAAGAARAARAAWAAEAAEAAGAAGAAWAARAARAAGAARAARAAWAAEAAGAAWAAWAAEREWQKARYRQYVTGRRPRSLPLPEVTA